MSEELVKTEVALPAKQEEEEEEVALVCGLMGCMVNVWTNDPNRGVQGIVNDWDDMFLRLRSVDGRDLFISWTSGPIIQRI